MALTRRYFLKSTGIALAGFAAVPSFLKRTIYGMTVNEGRTAAQRKIFIGIFQRGAADGLNIVVPFGERAYYDARPTLAIPEPKSGDENAAIDLDGFFGLHPRLRPFKPIYDAGRLAIVHAAGSPDNTRSHFDAQDYMESATPGVKSTTDGWLNRYLQSKTSPNETPFRAVSMTPNLPRTLQGTAPALAINNLNDFTLRAGPSSSQIQQGFESLYEQGVRDLLHETGTETFEAVNMLKKANPTQYKPENGAAYPNGPFGNALRQIAQLITSDVGLEVAFAEIGGWDTHAAEGSSAGQLANRLDEFSRGISALYADLGDRMENVVILTMSEFGRMVRENGSCGTDHGHANCLFLLGGPVKGGKVYGKWPGLGAEHLYEGRDLALTTDFRDVFGEVVAKHLGATNPSAIFPGYTVRPSNFRGLIV